MFNVLLIIQENEQLQQKGGRMTELLVGTGPQRLFSLISH